MSASDTNSTVSGIKRREFLNFAWLGSLGFLTLGLFSVFGKFSLPVRKKGEFGSVIDISSITELPGIDEAPLNHAKGKFWLVNSEKGLSAFYKACTHLDCLFTWSDQENNFVCPCHGSKFSKEGIVLTGPATRSLDQFPVQVYDTKGKLLIESDPAKGSRLKYKIETTQSESEEKRTIFFYLYQNQQLVEELSAAENTIVSVDTSRRILSG